MAQCICWSQLQLRSDPCPGSSVCSKAAKKEKRKKKKKKRKEKKKKNRVSDKNQDWGKHAFFFGGGILFIEAGVRRSQRDPDGGLWGYGILTSSRIAILVKRASWRFVFFSLSF